MSDTLTPEDKTLIADLELAALGYDTMAKYPVELCIDVKNCVLLSLRLREAARRLREEMEFQLGRGNGDDRSHWDVLVKVNGGPLVTP